MLEAAISLILSNFNLSVFVNNMTVTDNIKNKIVFG